MLNFLKDNSENQPTDCERTNARLDRLDAVCEPLGDDGEIFAKRAFRAGIEPEQAKHLVQCIKKLDAKAQKKVDRLESELNDRREALQAKNERIKELELESDGLRERLTGRGPSTNKGEGLHEKDFQNAIKDFVSNNDCSRGEAMKTVREEHPDLYERWHEAQQQDDASTINS